MAAVVLVVAMALTTPVNILTVASGRGSWRRQRFNFWKAQRPRWVAENVFQRRPLVGTLKRLDFIHAAGWAGLDRFPVVPGVEPEDPAHHWVLFVSNFNGPWEGYRDSFMDAWSRGIVTVWGPSVDFPPFPGPGTRYRTQAWSDPRLVDTLHYYVAYPGASSHDVRSALRVDAEVRGFLAARRSLDSALDAFRPGVAELHQVLHRLHHCLGQLAAPNPVPRPGPPGANGFTSVVSVAPIAAGHEDVLAARIRDLSAHGHSPFARTPGTHFARLAVIDRRRAGFHPLSQVPLRHSWLVLAADFDATVAPGPPTARPPEIESRRYFDSIGGIEPLAGLWDMCQGRNRVADLADYLLPTVVDWMLQFRDYPMTTLSELVVALRSQDMVRTRLAARALDTDAALDALDADLRAIPSR